ncbi:MAG TPA: glycosyltransferase family 39 protein [Abditibacteriaceae bacterium]|nr:glycosyltransferase family 39 protein [Abditibacteriaceae bacterium]
MSQHESVSFRGVFPDLFLLFLVALAVRCIGLRWGLPSAEHWYSYHPDERQIAVGVANLNFFAGDFNPNFFNYPSLYIYLTYVLYAVASGLGLTHQLAPNAPPVIWPFLHDITLTGRIVTAVLGAATVPLVYLIGREISGHRFALLAALLMAFLPGHVQHSHFATVDVPATFFVALSLYFAVRALRIGGEHSGSWPAKQLLITAGLAGLAAATKYNGGLVLVAPLVSWFLLSRRGLPKSGASLVLMLAAAVLGFLLGCPFSVLSFQEFWGDGKINGVAYELLVHPRQGSGDIFAGTGNGWWYHLSFNLPFVMTWPLLVVALLGITGAVLYRTRFGLRIQSAPLPLQSTALLPLLAWTVLYFGTLGLSAVRFMRYTLPLMPGLCIFIMGGVMLLLYATGSTARGRRWLPVTASLLYNPLWVIMVVGSMTVLAPFVATDPRDQAAEFFPSLEKTPTTIGLVSPPWFWTPPLSPQDAPPGSGTVVTGSPDGRYKFAVTGFDTTKLQRMQPQWFVMSEYEWIDKERLNEPGYKKFMAALRREYTLAARFSSPFADEPGYVPHDFLYTHPTIRIYRRGQVPPLIRTNAM